MTSAGRLLQAAGQVGTPCYVYDLDVIAARFATLREALGEWFEISYAVKANPNLGLLRRLAPLVDTFDVSSYAEVERALEVGCSPDRITFSGPAKRAFELEGAIRAGIGDLVLESVAEAEQADAVAREMGRRQAVLVRINPSWVPRHFGVNMAGRASQFGIDEEDLEPALDRIAGLPNLELAGFHIYSGTNSLSAPAIVANLTNFVQLFRRATARAGIRPRRLVFGSGFGIPYVDGDAPLDVAAVARDIIPVMRDLRAEPTFAATSFALEMGRWLVGPGGWLLTSVIAAKESRGTSIRACDAGFNNHLAACGMMGTVIRRNWVYANLSNPEGEVHSYMLVGPLCTTIDMLASGISLPEVRVGDLLAVANSGAYGLTASPTRFISHPEPSEVLVAGDAFEDATESRLNHPRRWAGGR